MRTSPISLHRALPRSCCDALSLHHQPNRYKQRTAYMCSYKVYKLIMFLTSSMVGVRSWVFPQVRFFFGVFPGFCSPSDPSLEDDPPSCWLVFLLFLGVAPFPDDGRASWKKLKMEDRGTWANSFSAYQYYSGFAASEPHSEGDWFDHEAKSFFIWLTPTTIASVRWFSFSRANASSNNSKYVCTALQNYQNVSFSFLGRPPPNSEQVKVAQAQFKGKSCQ